MKRDLNRNTRGLCVMILTKPHDRKVTRAGKTAQWEMWEMLVEIRGKIMDFLISRV